MREVNSLCGMKVLNTSFRKTGSSVIYVKMGYRISHMEELIFCVEGLSRCITYRAKHNTKDL